MIKAEFRDSLFLSKRLYDQTMQPVCDRFALTRMELDILLFLANNPAYDTASDLIERRGLAKSHVSVSVQALEKAGYLRRVFHPGNRKTMHLELLDAANPIVERGQAAQEAFFAAVFAGFTPQEQQHLRGDFARIANNIRKKLRGA